MSQVFLPLDVVFDKQRFQKTLESIFLDYDVDPPALEGAARQLTSYTLQDHARAVVSRKRGRIKEQEEEARHILSSIDRSIRLCWDRYLHPDGLKLLRGLTRKADVMVYARGHRNFYTEIIEHSTLSKMLRNGLRVFNRAKYGEDVVASANLRLTWYYLDFDAEELKRAKACSRTVKTAMIALDPSVQPAEDTEMVYRSFDELKKWFTEESLFTSIDEHDETFAVQQLALADE
jgi:hypothetical protein